MARTIRVASAFLVAALVSHPAQAQKVTTESSPTANLASLKTFAIREGVMRSPNAVLNTELMKQRIEGDISRALTAKGLTAASGTPDINVSFIFGSLAGRRRSASGVSGPGIEGNLIVDLRSPSGALLWHGVATVEEQNPPKVAEKVDDMVKKLFAKYPK